MKDQLSAYPEVGPSQSATISRRKSGSTNRRGPKHARKANDSPAIPANEKSESRETAGSQRFMSQVRASCFKTSMCTFFQRDSCNKGSDCTFAHSVSELRNPPDWVKTKLCNDFMDPTRTCAKDRSECAYAHGMSDLRVRRHFVKKNSQPWYEGIQNTSCSSPSTPSAREGPSEPRLQSFSPFPQVRVQRPCVSSIASFNDEIQPAPNNIFSYGMDSPIGCNWSYMTTHICATGGSFSPINNHNSMSSPNSGRKPWGILHNDGLGWRQSSGLGVSEDDSQQAVTPGKDPSRVYSVPYPQVGSQLGKSTFPTLGGLPYPSSFENQTQNPKH